MKPSAPNRHEQRRLRTREAIIKAAAELFLKKGVAATAVADITEAADVGYGTFYNHFHSMQDVISAVAERTMVKVAQIGRSMLPEEDMLQFAPAVIVRVFIRLMIADPSVRWLLDHPYVFVDEFKKAAAPLTTELLERGAATWPDGFQVIGGVETWTRMHPWMLVSELNDAIESGFSPEHEENFASMCLHLLGLDDKRRREVLETSRKIVDAALPPPRRQRPRGKRRLPANM